MRSIVIGRFTRTHQDGRTDFEKILGYKKEKKKRKTNYSDGLLLVDREFGYLSIQIVFTEPTERKTTWDFRFVANVQRFFFLPFRRRLVPIDATISFSRFVRSLLVNHVVTTPCRHVAIASPSCDVGVVVRLWRISQSDGMISGWFRVFLKTRLDCLFPQMTWLFYLWYNSAQILRPATNLLQWGDGLYLFRSI